MQYYIADPHLGHANIIRHCGRPFSCVKEMDDAIIAAWRRRVRPADTVYIVGDLMFFCPDPLRYLSLLTGRMRLITGNHDPVWMKKVCAGDHFESIGERLTCTDGERRLTLCHYPPQTRAELPSDGFFIYGHIHNNTDGPAWPLLHGMTRALNAGVEINGYQPVTLDELIENNRRFRAAHPCEP